MQEIKLRGIIMRKKKWITWFSLFILIFICIIWSRNLLSEGNNENMKINIKENTNEITLHFSADNRLPYSWYADWIVFDSFIRSVYGTLTELTPSGLFNTESEHSILDFIESEKGDPSKLIFRIKKGQYFEKNGEKIEFTSEDLKFSYSIPFFLEKEDIFEKSDLMKIKGMEVIKAGEVYSEDKVTGIEILDRYTIKIILKYPDPNIITNLSTSKYPIVSKYFYLNKKNDDLTPGLGKYEVFKIDKNTGEVILKRKKHVDNYPDYIKYISTADKTGDIFWSESWGNLNSKFEKKTIKTPVGTLGILFNYDSSIGKNHLFRKAIEFAINRNELVKEFEYYLLPNNEVLPNGYWGRIEEIERYNTQLAKHLLSKIKDIPNPLVIDAVLNEGELEAPFILRILNQLREVGLNPILKLHKGEEPFNSAISITAIAVPYKNPSSVFQFFVDGSVYKNSYPRNDKNLANLIYSLETSFLDKDKLKYAQMLSRYFYENNVFIPLWDFLNVFYVNKDTIETLGNQPGGMNFNIWEVKIKNGEKKI